MLILLSILLVYFLELCPSLFGRFECPLNYTCKANECYSSTNQTAPNDCKQVKCDSSSRFLCQGRCYEAKGLPCNRNVEVSKNHFKSVNSFCGLNGKCVNGRCVEDKCLGITCRTDEMCRDGICATVTNTFCISSFDCGPLFECNGSRCVPLEKSLPCKCNPGELCQQRQCIQNPGCSHITCKKGMSCVQGICQSNIGRDCTYSSCEEGTICVEGRCVLDPCIDRCPSDHICREGQCRHIQGLPCHIECPETYVCVDGRCTKDGCYGNSCQIGEACENGFCIRVEGRLCSLAVRECAEHFDCISGTCHDMFSPNSTYESISMS
ncbi:unnamed protein product [Thelazia callipaeda]|uniref:EB domain-containing protein n=1 Tax=Thelazia callipaeda TaxID=103827 RepID=A0A0N5D058_THECL|nr:unnamed protein product [Thelazia callipaeda]